jgi:hypothetical protein
MPWNQINASDGDTASVNPTAIGGLGHASEKLSTLRTDLITALGTRSDTTNAQIDKWVNKGYRTVWNMIDVPEQHSSLTASIIAGTYKYFISLNAAGGGGDPFFRWIDSVGIVDTTTYVQGGREFKKIDLSIYRKLDELTDEPTSFFMYNRVLVLWPTPKVTRNVLIEGSVAFTDVQRLVNDNDTIALTIEWSEVILLAARWKALRDLREWGNAATAKNDFIDEIRPMLNKEAEDKARGSTMARVIPVRSVKDYFRRRA